MPGGQRRHRSAERSSGALVVLGARVAVTVGVPETDWLSLAPLGQRPEHMSQSGSVVQPHPATQDFIERHRKRRTISRRAIARKQLTRSWTECRENSLPADLRPEQDSNLRPTA